MIRVIGSKGNALASSLQESFRNLIFEGTYKDSRADVWKSHKAAYRMENHPLFVKHKDNPKLDGVQFDPEPKHVFRNARSGEIHEGPVLLDAKGTISPYSHSGNVHLFHSDHYAFGKE